MSGFLLALAAVTNTAQNLLRKQFSLRCTGGTALFNTLLALSATVFFACVADWEPVTPVLWGYSAAFAVCYLSASLGLVLAIQTGSLAKTSLILSYSLLVPTVVGLVFWEESLTAFKGIGFALLVLSLFLTNYRKEVEAGKVSFKWIFFVLLAFVGNGMCTVFQRMGQAHDPGGGMLMVLALTMVTVSFLVITLCTEWRGGEAVTAAKRGGWLAVLCGLLNGFTNYLVVVLNGKLPASVLFPVIAAGGMVVTLLFSVFLYKEKFTRPQLLGFVVGIAAIVLLNM